MDEPSSTLNAAFRACAEQLQRVLPSSAGFAFVTAQGALRWSSFETGSLSDELLDRARTVLAADDRQARAVDAARRLALIPVTCAGEIVVALLTPFEPKAAESMQEAVDRTWRRFRPALDRLARQLTHEPPAYAGAARSAEGAEELEWLLEIEAELRGAADASAALVQLLVAAVDKMNASFGALTTPDRRLNLTYASRAQEHADSQAAYQQAHPYVMSYMQRRCAPLMANRPPGDASATPRCKIMGVPIAARHGKQIGALAFCRPLAVSDFSRRDLYVAQHLARLIEALLAARHDPTTGLLTRASLEQDAAAILAGQGDDEPHCLMYVDVDHLHVINETFGFDFGDQAIGFIAKLLQPPHLPSNAVCGRVAGDRFIAFLPKCNEGRALHLAHLLQREVNKLTVGVHPQRIALSVSCGVAGVPRTAAAFSKAMAAAELACRTAKERGRDRSEVYLDIDDSMMHRKGDILGVVRLRAALDKDRLQMFAQRVAPLRDRERTSGIECLARLVAEDGAIIPPSEFLSAAARYQMLRAVDEWMLEHALAALHSHATMLFHGEIHVALNISAQSLHDDDFLRFLEDRVRGSELAPRLITLEINEADAARDVGRTSAVLRRWRKLGCSIALDNFGARAASLTHLESLRPDRVKIDAAVVRGVLTSAESEAALSTIVAAADAARIECVAKHVDSEALLRKLRELGVSHAQGNCLHEAEPLAKLLEALDAEEQRQLERLYQQQ